MGDACSCSRRTFVTRVASVGIGALIGPKLSTLAQAAAPPALASYELGPQIWVRRGGKTLTCYRAHPTQKYPYFYPLAGPATGISLTIEAGEPYPHHRSVFLACDRVNGANYWQEGLDRGQIVSRGPVSAAAGGQEVVITDVCEWRVGNGPCDLTDQRRFAFSVLSPQIYAIDVDITLTTARDVHIERTNHSLFAVRAAPELAPIGGGALINAEGRSGEKDTMGQTTAWCAFFGQRFGYTEGIALMDHPQNPWSPCRWFTRDYGFISPTPMNWLGPEGLSWGAGTNIRLGYLVVAFAGTPEAADLPGLYALWAASG